MEEWISNRLEDEQTSRQRYSQSEEGAGGRTEKEIAKGGWWSEQKE
jgi:hypothetical protein